MLRGIHTFQRYSFVAHEAKHFRRQGPLGRPPDTPVAGNDPTGIQNTVVSAPPTPTPTPVTTSTPAERRTTVTTVVAAPITTSLSSTSISSATTSSTTTSTTSTSLSTSTTPSTTSTLKPNTSSLPVSTQGKPSTIFQTTFAPTSALPTTTADGASASSSSDSSSGISTAGIVGIAAAAIVGIAVVTGLIMFFVRRLRKGDDYDVDNLRRQSVVLGDDSASLHRGNSDGFNARPRPPTMIERHYANIAPSHASPFSGIRPGEVMPSSGLAPSFPPASRYQQTYFDGSMGQTPVGSPVSVAPYGSAYDSQGHLVRTPSQSAMSTLSRGKSIRDPFNDPQQPSQEEGDYANMSRASVTPFQAAQYAAISRELNIPPPVPTIPPSVNLEKPMFPQDQPLDSPFSDLKGDVNQDQGRPAVDDSGLQPARASSEFQHQTFSAYTDDARVASLPPMLSPQQSANLLSPQEEMNFPVSPSPLRSEFNISSTNVSALPSPVITAFAGQGPSVSTGSPLRYAVGAGDDSASQKVASNTSTKRPQSSYEDEDAYGGF